MRSLGKNIAFWRRYYLDMAFGILVSGLVVLLFVGIQMSSYPNGLEMIPSLTGLVPVYWLLMGGIWMVAMTGGFYKIAVPLSLSMGNTRKTTICGMNLTYAAVCMTFALITVGVWKASGMQKPEIEGAFLIVGGIYLTEGAVSIVTGIIYSLWGKWGIVAAAIVCGCLGAALGASVNMIEEQEVMIRRLFSMLGNPRICLAAGVVFFAAAAFLNYFVHRKAEVRL